MQINETYKNIATTLIRGTTLRDHLSPNSLDQSKKKKKERNLPITSQMFSVYS